MKKILTTAMALILVVSLTACNDSNNTETLTGQAQGYNGPINVTVTREGDNITQLEVEHNETPEFGGEAIEELSSTITRNGSTDGVELVSGATTSSQAFIDAINNAN